MRKNPVIFLYEFIKGEMRTILALGLLLLIWVSYSWAAGGNSYTFDFGTGLSSEIAPGSIPVNGGVATYPQSSGDIQFGWQTSMVAEQSSGAEVSDLLETDSNQGATNNNFKVTGLSGSYYDVTLISGNLNNSITTKVVVNGVSYVADSGPGVWRTLTFKAATTGGSMEFNFQRAGTNLWAVNALTLTPSASAPTTPSFDLVILPTEHTVKAGGSAIYQIAVVPHDGYASQVILSLGDVPGGLQTSMSPLSGVPNFSSHLQINTTADTPVSYYTVTLTAKGQDSAAQTINKQIGLTVANFLPAINDIEPMTGEDEIPVVSGEEFEKQAKQNQATIDEYLSWQNRALLNNNELDTLSDISWLASVEVLPELPQPRSTFDASLRQLTNAGIIGMVVDSAPVASELPPSQAGFWARFFGSMFNPAQ